MYTQEVRDFARKIGQFYLAKNEGDYEKAHQEILDLRITNIQVIDNDTMAITTIRPGLLIGKRGHNIDSLSQYLACHVKILEDTDDLLNYLIPLPPEDDDWMFGENS